MPKGRHTPPFPLATNLVVFRKPAMPTIPHHQHVFFKDLFMHVCVSVCAPAYVHCNHMKFRTQRPEEDMKPSGAGILRQLLATLYELWNLNSSLLWEQQMLFILSHLSNFPQNVPFCIWFKFYIQHYYLSFLSYFHFGWSIPSDYPFLQNVTWHFGWETPTAAYTWAKCQMTASQMNKDRSGDSWLMGMHI